ncbi:OLIGOPEPTIDE TRANSPORTER [Encephalitozoon cuniculi GB-M1]|uniref:OLIGOPEPTIDE TRANSPORTER n=2 Tax=Encephalitozoon cuniculi TaxID=6035 RepID=Q8SQV8_ENCCU|nr:Ptr2p-like protein [Encephalitozoon cuniculi GB-M1]AGE94877.1 oligopeptide transporter [Encephalitozoon cuniculi]KMV65063.1 putative proton-dependent oligopeptide transportprotein [Encephalitozoon cuniculi EcunIII-L]UYI26308.1 peptide transporter [Encephalitozoon cuniculi]CAD26015.1 OLIGOPEPTIDE TRANSPORTER [Encephalitozoon cuniculi GB-M1]
MTIMNGTTLFLIICNEFCERFCFYGLKSLLFSFTRSEYGFTIKESTVNLHFFISMSYLFTLFGGLLSDMFLGRYSTIVLLSSLYLTGTSLLTYCSIVSGSPGLMVGSLLMIAVGTGGIKPCVAAFGGDQFGPDDAQDLRRFFDFFYFAINIGSMVSMVLTPTMSSVGCLGKQSCYPLAFGTSSTLLGASILLFIIGKRFYVIKPVRKEQFSRTFHSLVQNLKELFRRQSRDSERKTQGTLKTVSEAACISHEEDDKEKTLKILRILGPAAFFWMLSDQQSSSWVEQGTKMETHQSILGYGMDILPSQMQAFNAVFILLFIPLFSKMIYPLMGLAGVFSSPEEKMGFGIALASLSFFCSGYLEYRIGLPAPAGQRLSIMWQLPQYVLMTAGEIMLNVTGMEYMYTEAPEPMKSLVSSMWLLTVTAGNLLVMVLTFLDPVALFSSRAHDMWSFVAYGTAGLLASRCMFQASKAAKRNRK